MNEHIYTIPAVNLGTLEKKIERLSRRAAKLGSPDVGMEMLEGYEDVENDDGTVTRFYPVRVTGQAPRLNGWRFVAKLQHLGEGTWSWAQAQGTWSWAQAQGNVIRAIPGESVPERFRTVEPWCEHCNMRRHRKDTFVAARGDEYKQVGSSCLADFTGHQSPDAAAQTAEYLIQADELCNEAVNDDWLGGGGGPTLLRTEHYLAYVAAEARRNGWTSRSADPSRATADCAIVTMQLAGKNRYTSDIQEPLARDWEKAQRALVWAREELSARDRLSDYEWNLVRVCESDVIETSWIGYAASLIPTYEREIERQAETEVSAGQSHYVGTIGQRQHFEGLTVTTVIPLPGQYGVTNLHKFLDPNGNVLIWFASNAELERELVYGGKATVKAHDEYQDVRQTVLTRCKFEAVDAEVFTDG